MERLVSVIEAFFRPRDNYTTGARTAAFLLVALSVFLIDQAIDESLNPWVTAFLMAGSLNLFALIFNVVRVRRERAYAVLTDARDHVIEMAANLSALNDERASAGRRANAMASMLEAYSLLVQLEIDRPDPIEAELPAWEAQASQLILACDERIAELRNRPGWAKRAVSYFLGSQRSMRGA